MGREGFEPPKPSGGGFTVHSLWPLGHLPTFRCRVRAAPSTRTRHRGSLRQGIESLPRLLKKGPLPKIPGIKHRVPDTRDPTPRTLPHSYIGSLDKSHRFGKSPGSRPRIIAFSPYCRIAPLPDCLPTQLPWGRTNTLPRRLYYTSLCKRPSPSGRGPHRPPSTLRRPHSDIPSPSYRPPSPPSSRAELRKPETSPPLPRSPARPSEVPGTRPMTPGAWPGGGEPSPLCFNIMLSTLCHLPPPHVNRDPRRSVRRLPRQDAYPLGALGSVPGARCSVLGVDPVPGPRRQVPGTWHPYRIPIPEGKDGIPAGFPIHIPKNPPMESASCILHPASPHPVQI